MEEITAGLAARIQAAVHAHAVDLLNASAVELQHLEARGDVPDVDEGDTGKVAAPLHGDADAAEKSVDVVAETLAAVEALVGVAPHAVHGANSLGLRQDIFKSDLQMVVDIVGVTVDEVEVGHGEYVPAEKLNKLRATPDTASSNVQQRR